jgi:hypothetical protein
MIKTLALALVLAACGGKQSSNPSSTAVHRRRIRTRPATTKTSTVARR